MWFIEWQRWRQRQLRSRRASGTDSLRRARFRPQLETFEERDLLSAGALDPNFGTGGLTTDFQGPLDTPGQATAVQADGKLVMVGGFYDDSSAGFTVARYNPDGGLDATFGASGTVATTFRQNANSGDRAMAVAIQGDGRIVVAGDTGLDFGLARYNPDGSLDASFGTAGKVKAHYGDSEHLTGMALEPDGKILVTGAAVVGAAKDFVLARYNSDGSPDSTFGTNGTVLNSIGTANGLTVQPDGKIIVVGATPTRVNAMFTTTAFEVVRYNANGSLDTTFGSSGRVVTQFPAICCTENDEAAAVVLQPDGKIVVGGSSTDFSQTFGTHRYALARYNSDGSLDASFVGGGEVTSIKGNITSLALQSDGEIVAAGGIGTLTEDEGIKNNGLTLARFTPTGGLDTTFGTQGSVTEEIPVVTTSVVVQSDGRIVVSGNSGDSPNQRFTLSRFTSTGRVDPKFGSGGQVTTSIGPGSATAGVVLVQPDGKIVIAGSGSQALDVTRYNPNGALDATFGNGGKVTLPFSGAALNSNGGAIAGAVLQPDGKILVTGTAFQTNGPSLALVRFNMDGSLDSGFGSGGVVISTTGLNNGRAVALQPDGAILVAATGNGASSPSSGSLSLLRFKADGSLDASFTAIIPTVQPANVAPDVGGLTLQSDGKIVLSVYEGGFNNTNKYALLRFNPSGSLDAAFGNGGSAAIDFSGKVRVEPDGRIVVIGSNVGPGADRAVAMARYFPNGNPDTTFGTGGKAIANFGPNGGPPNDFTLQPDGKILVAGRAAGNSLAVARFDPNGNPDNSFGTNGVATASQSDRSGSSTSLALQPDGRILEAGTVSAGQGQAFGLVRFLGDDRTGTPTQRFVTQVYLDLLGRSAEPAGMAFFTGLLNQGTSRAEVVGRIEGSQEYHTRVIQSLYGLYLGRAADPVGLSGWDAFLTRGGTAEQLAALLLGSDEYLSKHGGNNTAFLQALYNDVLQRPIDATGAQGWGQALANGTSRGAVAAAVLGSRESDTLEVQDLYRHFLCRSADSSGLDAFTNALQQGVPNEQVLALIIASDEYFARLGR
jgi:uncharacterized delta-60 repeat protein